MQALRALAALPAFGSSSNPTAQGQQPARRKLMSTPGEDVNLFNLGNSQTTGQLQTPGVQGSLAAGAASLKNGTANKISANIPWQSNTNATIYRGGMAGEQPSEANGWGATSDAPQYGTGFTGSASAASPSFGNYAVGTDYLRSQAAGGVMSPSALVAPSASTVTADPHTAVSGYPNQGTAPAATPAAASPYDAILAKLGGLFDQQLADSKADTQNYNALWGQIGGMANPWDTNSDAFRGQQALAASNVAREFGPQQRMLEGQLAGMGRLGTGGDEGPLAVLRAQQSQTSANSQNQLLADAYDKGGNFTLQKLAQQVSLLNGRQNQAANTGMALANFGYRAQQDQQTLQRMDDASRASFLSSLAHAALTDPHASDLLKYALQLLGGVGGAIVGGPAGAVAGAAAGGAAGTALSTPSTGVDFSPYA